MNDMRMEFGRIRARAQRLARGAQAAGMHIDADTLTQQTFSRFYEVGLDSRVDSAKGSALMLLYRVLAFVYLEALRAERRDRQLSNMLDRERIQRDPLSEVIELEHMLFLRDAMRDAEKHPALLTEREREALLRVYGSLFDQHAITRRMETTVQRPAVPGRSFATAQNSFA